MPFATHTPLTTLVITGGPTRTMPLNAKGPTAWDKTASLFMAAPPEGRTTLWIGVSPNVRASGDAALYVNGSYATDGSDPPVGGAYEGNATLAIPATAGFPDDKRFNLHIESYLIGSGINTAPLFLPVPEKDPYPTASTTADLVVAGDVASAGSAPGTTTANATLAIESNIENNDNAPLHIEKDFNTSTHTTLYINNRMGSGHLPLAMESTYVSSDNVPLIIRTPPSGNISLYTSGYLE